jgi:hypothetical protein
LTYPKLVAQPYLKYMMGKDLKMFLCKLLGALKQRLHQREVEYFEVIFAVTSKRFITLMLMRVMLGCK